MFSLDINPKLVFKSTKNHKILSIYQLLGGETMSILDRKTEILEYWTSKENMTSKEICAHFGVTDQGDRNTVSKWGNKLRRSGYAIPTTRKAQETPQKKTKSEVFSGMTNQVLALKLWENVQHIKLRKPFPQIVFDQRVYTGVRQVSISMGWTVPKTISTLLYTVLDQYGVLKDADEKDK